MCHGILKRWVPIREETHLVHFVEMLFELWRLPCLPLKFLVRLRCQTRPVPPQCPCFCLCLNIDRYDLPEQWKLARQYVTSLTSQ